MSVRQLSSKSKSQVLRRLSRTSQASPVSLDTLMSDGKLPMDLKWQPSWCIARGDETILVHILASPDLPPYLERAINKLREDGFHNTYVLIFARDLILEATEEEAPTRLLAPYAASAVAEKAMNLGCALAFEAEKSVQLVFDGSYSAPHRCRQNRKETGHIPNWLYTGLAASADFSPELRKLLSGLQQTMSAQRAKTPSQTNAKPSYCSTSREALQRRTGASFCLSSNSRR